MKSTVILTTWHHLKYSMEFMLIYIHNWPQEFITCEANAESQMKQQTAKGDGLNNPKWFAYQMTFTGPIIPWVKIAKHESKEDSEPSYIKRMLYLSLSTMFNLVTPGKWYNHAFNQYLSLADVWWGQITGRDTHLPVVGNGKIPIEQSFDFVLQISQQVMCGWVIKHIAAHFNDASQ